jgi:hypothetical protein
MARTARLADEVETSLFKMMRVMVSPTGSFTHTTITGTAYGVVVAE